LSSFFVHRKLVCDIVCLSFVETGSKEDGETKRRSDFKDISYKVNVYFPHTYIALDFHLWWCKLIWWSVIERTWLLSLWII